MTGKILTLGFILSLISGCTQFQTGRSYMAEMDHDDTRFFNPDQDFPIVAGDSGRYWMTEKERRQRTPSSEGELLYNRSENALRSELRRLENSQGDDHLEFYNDHKHRFHSISENIYFLKLPHYERKNYLIERGFIQPKMVSSSVSTSSLDMKNDVILGMKKDQVTASLGKPVKVEIAGNPQNENERWLYRMNGASKYIYFESGEVQGWE
jgi:hypothetical protein